GVCSTAVGQTSSWKGRAGAGDTSDPQASDAQDLRGIIADGPRGPGTLACVLTRADLACASGGRGACWEKTSSNPQPMPGAAKGESEGQRCKGDSERDWYRKRERDQGSLDWRAANVLPTRRRRSEKVPLTKRARQQVPESSGDEASTP
ncbi:hypothetical protein GBAR_LOCUS29501, partial [Geodia barretti]